MRSVLLNAAAKWPAGIIVASAGQMPPAAAQAYQNAFERRPRRRKPWLRLAAPLPGITFAELHLLHRAQIHAAVARRIGGKMGGAFAASLSVDLGQGLQPHLIVATTRYRAPGGWCDRIDLAAVPCAPDAAAHYSHPADPEVSRWAFDHYAAGAPYKVVLNRFGGQDNTHPWGVDWSCRR